MSHRGCGSSANRMLAFEEMRAHPIVAETLLPTSRTSGAPAFGGSTSGLPVIRAPVSSTVFVLSGVS